MSSTTITHVLAMGLEGSFYVVTLIFVGFSLSISYHLLAYGTNKAKSLLMLSIYLGVSAFLFLSMFITLTFL